MATTVQAIDLITINPTVRNGQPCIVGTSLRVTDVVVASLFHQRAPSDIAGDYDLSLAQVHAALAYYYSHKTELDALIRRQVDTAHLMKEQRLGR